MEVRPEQLAKRIVSAYKLLPDDQRLIVAIAGPPGSGKSTLAYPLTDHLNALLLHHRPLNPSHIERPKGLELAEASDAQGGDDEIALCVGLDGWHYSRAELDGFDDPEEAHWRRGAAFTFDQQSYHSFLLSLRQPLSSPNAKSIPFPTFDHALKDPSIAPIAIHPRHRIIVIEGLYTLLDREGWRDSAEMADMRVWVEVDRAEARSRVVRRNFEAGIVDSIEACEKRVDAVDMANGEEVRFHRVQPDYIVTSIEGSPFSTESFDKASIGSEAT
ncbi:hypothetical protein IAU59_006461 [Kwoniella sp. CBS 9459]